MNRAVWEGDCVRHESAKFVGMHVGFTQIAGLMERSGDVRGVRVQLPDGTIKIASEQNLTRVELDEYKQYALSLGVNVKSRKSV